MHVLTLVFCYISKTPCQKTHFRGFYIRKSLAIETKFKFAALLSIYIEMISGTVDDIRRREYKNIF